MGSNPIHIKDTGVFAEGRSSLEALLQNLRSVGLHPSSLPIGSAAGKAVSSGDSQASAEQDSEGLKDRGALLVAD